MSDEIRERGARTRLDQLLSHEFQLKKEDVEKKIKELNGKLANCQDENWVKNEIAQRTQRKKETIMAAIAESVDNHRQLAALLMDGFSQNMSVYRQFMETGNKQFITDDIITASVDEFSVSLLEDYKERERLYAGWVSFANEQGAESIFGTWSQVWDYIKSISLKVSSDDEVYKLVKTKFPIFCQEIANYMAFVRDMPWHLDLEAIIAQRVYAANAMERLKAE